MCILPLLFHLLMHWIGKFTDQKSAAFPYMLASKPQQRIFDKNCVPHDFVLGDPDHITDLKIRELYNHWLDRQQKQLPAFVVLRPGPLHQAARPKSAKSKGKRKLEYLDVNTDDEEVKSPVEEDSLVEEEGHSEPVAGPSQVRFGPPTTKPHNVAGPSKQSIPPQSKDRKAEEDPEPLPLQTSKTGQGTEDLPMAKSEVGMPTRLQTDFKVCHHTNPFAAG